jgi:coatomer subunit epsilon
MTDALFQVRNLFYLGAFQSAIHEAQDLAPLSETDRVERDVVVYRSYIALGSAQVRGCTSHVYIQRFCLLWAPTK